jgi:hypothetical protein
MNAADNEAFLLAQAGKWSERFRLANAILYRVGTSILLIKTGADKPAFVYRYSNVVSSHDAFVAATRRRPLLITSSNQ